MRRTIGTLVLAFAIALAGGTNAQAITGNFTADTEHTYVGLIAFYDENGEFVHRCSGALLTDEVFLTAGHCVTVDDEGTLATSARIWFEQDAGADYDPVTDTPATSGYPYTGGVTASTLYSYGFEGLTVPQTYDVGLVILDQPVTDVYPDITEYASLGHAGILDEYTADHPGNTGTVTVSGYGVSYTNGNPDKTISYRSRLEATTFIIGLNSTWAGGFNVHLASNPGDGRGGTCFGDSGGPVLLDASDVVVAVNSFVTNGACAGTGYSYRTDQADVLAWILEHAGDDAGDIVIV